MPPTTRSFVETFLEDNGVGYELCTVQPGGQYLFRLADGVVGFLAHCPVCAAHVWGRPDFGDLDNNEALAGLAARGGKIVADQQQALVAFYDVLDKLSL